MNRRFLLAGGFIAFALVLLVAFAVAKPDPVMSHFGICVIPQELVNAPDCAATLGDPTGNCNPGDTTCKQGAGQACVWRCGHNGQWITPGSWCTSKMCNDKLTACDPGPAYCSE